MRVDSQACKRALILFRCPEKVGVWDVGNF
jgi:hypothetical protein